MKKEKRILPTRKSLRGGGTLNNPEGLKKYKKENKKVKIIISSIIGIILLIGGITFYRTFALYEEKKEFNVLKGKIVAGKTKVVAKIDGVETTMPEKEVLFMESLSCDNGIESSWDYKDWKITTEESLKNSTCTISFLSPKNFAEYIEYKRYQDDSIEEFSHSATYQTPDLTDYRYTGANPDNYVCFGSEVSSCPSDNLYRVIGVIPTQSEIDGTYENRVKLIKATEWIGVTAQSSTYTPSGKGYLWNTVGNNKWETSSLKNTLNTEYWKSLGNYQQYIEKSKWYLGAPNYNTGVTLYTPENFYEEERSNVQGYSKGVTSYIDNIGLMYPSDFAYSIGNNYKNKNYLENKLKYKDAWMYSGGYSEWIISPEPEIPDSGTSAWQIIGYILSAAVRVKGQSNVSGYFLIRPTFYLKENVLYKSGDGSKTNPYRINI